MKIFQYLEINSRERHFDEYAGRVLGMYIILNALNVAISLFLPNSRLSDFSVYVIGIVLWFRLLIRFSFFRRAFRTMMIAYVISALVFIVGWWQGSSSFFSLLTRFLWLLVFGIPLFGVFIHVRNHRIALQSSVNCVYPCACVAVFTIVALLAGRGFERVYSMALGYALLYPSLLLMYLVKQKKKAVHLILLAINLFVLVSYGSRGQLLCIVIFLVLFIVHGGKRFSAKRLVLITLATIAVLCIALNLRAILLFLVSLLEKRGIYSRTLTIFLEKATYTGRERTWEATIGRIAEKPLLGWTIGVDIYADGFYPHQLFLEFFLHYGCILGGLISACVILLVFQKVFLKKRFDCLTAILFCYGFVPLMVSSEYLMWPSFWAFLALCMSRKRKHRGLSAKTICLLKQTIIWERKSYEESNDSIRDAT